MSPDTPPPLRDRYPFRYTRNPGVCNSVTCIFECHGKRCHCGYASSKANTKAQPNTATPPPAPAPSTPAVAPTPRPKSASKTPPPNPDIIYAPGTLPDEPATPDTPNGTPISPISISPDGEPLISLRLANRYFMLLWGAILRGVAPYPDAQRAMAATLNAYSQFYPSPFAQG